MNSFTPQNNSTPRREPRSRALPRLARIAAIALLLPLVASQTALADTAPAIESADPVSGPPGTNVRVGGSGFNDVTEVLLGGESTQFARHSDSLIVFKTPTLPPGEYPIVVSGPDGDDEACCFDLTGDGDAGDDADDDNATGEEPTGGDGPEAEAPPIPDASCVKPAYNTQCNAFGKIAMEAQRDIRGDRIKIAATTQLDYIFEPQGARWVLFSVRNVTADGTNPVTIQVDRFATPHGDIVTTRVDDDKPNEVNLWVHVIDVPVGEPISLDLTVGSTDRGAYRLETLVMVFDRGYAPLRMEDGTEVSLFSFTLLGVNKATSAESAGGLSRVGDLPSPGIVAGIIAVAATLYVLRRRSA